MKVRDVMRTHIVSISPDASYEGAAKLMHAEGLSALIVIRTDGTLAGILSEKDLFRAMYPDYGEYFVAPEAFSDEEERERIITDIRKEPITKYMTQHVLTVGPDTPLMLAGGLMLSRHIHHIPVVEEGKLVGIVTREHIFGTILKSKLGY